MHSSSTSSASVVELRSYPMRPFGRDSFIDNFEAHYLEEMEPLGGHRHGAVSCLGRS